MGIGELAILVALMIAFLVFVYVVARFAIGDGLRDYYEWLNRKK